ncbi:unnamed protein product [Haemonchus placei]|uniref:Secreted protein n=1 Tax=Haemonchus placei TaxID=6290 RepID=A0A0N4WUK6_HAEPC|nr:unnamed protein product [Haemonchus placei]
MHYYCVMLIVLMAIKPTSSQMMMGPMMGMMGGMMPMMHGMMMPMMMNHMQMMMGMMGGGGKFVRGFFIPQYFVVDTVFTVVSQCQPRNTIALVSGPKGMVVSVHSGDPGPGV